MKHRLMKTRENELEEMIDLVIKLSWTYTVFRALFAKKDADSEVRQQHPEFFLTMHDSLFCGFCVATEILFEEKEKATSLWSLIRKSKPQVAHGLSEKIRAHNSSIENIEAIRHQVCAHRWQAKSPQEVFAEVRPRLSMMAEINNLGRFVLLELVGEVDSNRRTALERQQLGELRLRSVTDDASQVMRAFRLCSC